MLKTLQLQLLGCKLEASMMCLLKAFPNHWEIKWVSWDFCSCFLFLYVHSNSKQFIFYPATLAPRSFAFSLSKQAEISNVLYWWNSTQPNSPRLSALPQQLWLVFRCMLLLSFFLPLAEMPDSHVNFKKKDFSIFLFGVLRWVYTFCINNRFWGTCTFAY